jgi:hypothetical protein
MHLILVTPVVVVALTIFLLGFMSPYAIAVSGDQIVVTYAFRKINLPIHQITELRENPYEHWSKGLIRTFGVGWPLPPAGRFWSKQLGHITIYSTRRGGELVLIKIGDKSIFLSLTEKDRNSIASQIAKRT